MQTALDYGVVMVLVLAHLIAGALGRDDEPWSS